ncbi:hypothetical protein [Salinispora arenicola]|uniref:hypothetical protein n=1 Tax=Salinispora arenicola TaxID=168697 RepID=UPI00030604A5|nr:hypothetical protein [Salinispora arenicola]MCN0177778.1 hypothetical protein [Salinispora arenicola]
MPDPLFAELFGDTENLNWDPAEQVRERARQRMRRTRIVAGLASAVAVAVVATSAVAVAGNSDSAPPLPPATNGPSPSPTVIPTPTMPPTPTPSPTTAPPSQPPENADRPTLGPPSPDIPAAAMLRVADLPAGFRAAGDDLDGDWSFHAGTHYACKEDGQSWPGEEAFRGAVFRKGSEGTVIERVGRHSEEDAKSTMGNVRREVVGCEPLNQDSGGMEVFDSRLAGDESLLVGMVGQRSANRWLFVRQGGLVAQVWLKGVDPAEDQRIAERTAARLCAGTDAC